MNEVTTPVASFGHFVEQVSGIVDFICRKIMEEVGFVESKFGEMGVVDFRLRGEKSNMEEPGLMIE